MGPEDVSLLERCPHFRGWYVQASMELGPEDMSLLERCPYFKEWSYEILHSCWSYEILHSCWSYEILHSCFSGTSNRCKQLLKVLVNNNQFLIYSWPRTGKKLHLISPDWTLPHCYLIPILMRLHTHTGCYITSHTCI